MHIPHYRATPEFPVGTKYRSIYVQKLAPNCPDRRWHVESYIAPVKGLGAACVERMYNDGDDEECCYSRRANQILAADCRQDTCTETERDSFEGFSISCSVRRTESDVFLFRTFNLVLFVFELHQMNQLSHDAA